MAFVGPNLCQKQKAISEVWTVKTQKTYIVETSQQAETQVFFLPQKLTYTLKNDGWKTIFPLEWSLFLGGRVNFRGGGG